MRRPSCRVLSMAAKLVGVAGLVASAAACSEADVLEVDNPCPELARIVTWGGSEPVLDVAAGSVSETTSFSRGRVSLVTSNGLVELAPSEPDYDGGPSRYVASVSEAQCDDLGDDIVDVIVVDDAYTGDDPDPVRIRLYSADPARLDSPEPIVAALADASPTTSQGPGFVTVEFVPAGPTDWNGEVVDYDATDVVNAALSIAGPGTVVLDCSGYDCAMATTAASDQLTSPFIVPAQTAGTVTGNGTFQTILGLVFIAILALLAVIIIRRFRRKRRQRRRAMSAPAWPPPAPQ